MDRLEPRIDAVKGFFWVHRLFLGLGGYIGFKGRLWRLWAFSTGVYLVVKAGVRGLVEVAQIGLWARGLRRRGTRLADAMDGGARRLILKVVAAKRGAGV